MSEAAPVLDNARTAQLIPIHGFSKRPPLQFLGVDDLLWLPPAEWLVKGVIEVDSQAILYGPSGAGKSFVMLDLALSVAAGIPWHGRPVKQGPILYIAGEGGRGLRKRVRAWMQKQSLAAVPDAMFLIEPVQLLDGPQVDALLSRLKSWERPMPRLIVIDTLARAFVGHDENSAADTGKLVHSARVIQNETGATVLFVHHTGKLPKEGSRPQQERGSSALRGAADAMLAVSRVDDDRIQLDLHKSKDEQEGSLALLRLCRVVVETDPETGDEISSCVLEAVEEPRDPQGLPRTLRAALVALSEQSGAVARTKAWREATAKALTERVAEKTFDNWRRKLVPTFVEAVPGNPPQYRLTRAGYQAIGTPLADGAPVPSPTPATPPPL